MIFNRQAPIHADDITQAIRGETLATRPEPGTEEQIIRKWVRRAIESNNEKNTYDALVDRFASIIIGEALNITGGNRSRAAKFLKLSRPTLHSKIEKYGLKMKTSTEEDRE